MYSDGCLVPSPFCPDSPCDCPYQKDVCFCAVDVLAHRTWAVKPDGSTGRALRKAGSSSRVGFDVPDCQGHSFLCSCGRVYEYALDAKAVCRYFLDERTVEVN